MRRLFQFAARSSGRGQARRLAAALVGGLVVLAGSTGAASAHVPASGTVAEAQEPVQLRLRLVPGELRRYTLDVRLSAELPDEDLTAVELNSQLTYLTLAVHADGSATVVSRFEQAHLTVDGEPQPIPELEGLEIQMRLTPEGAVRDVEVHGQPGRAERLPESDLFDPALLGGLLPQFPARGLRVGESFEQALRLPLPLPSEDESAPLTLQTRVTLAAIERVDGQPAARLTQAVTVPSASVPLFEEVALRFQVDASGTSLVSLATGWPLASEATAGVVVGLGGGDLPPLELSVDVEMSLRLLSEAPVRGK